MTRDERLRYEMFLRVRDFGNAHRQHFPDESMGGKAFRAVEAAIAEVEARATEKILTATEGRQAKASARHMLVDRLASIARTARLMSKSVPGSGAVFQLPEHSSDVELLTAARACVREGEAAMDRFVLLGMPKTFVNDLQALVDSFEQAMHGRRVGKAGAAAARAGLKTAIVQGLDAVSTLDIVVANTLKDDRVALGAWKRDRRINSKTKTDLRGQSHSVSADRPRSETASAVATATTGAEPVPTVQPPGTPGPPAGESSTPTAAAPDDLERRAS